MRLLKKIRSGMQPTRQAQGPEKATRAESPGKNHGDDSLVPAWP